MESFVCHVSGKRRTSAGRTWYSALNKAFRPSRGWHWEAGTERTLGREALVIDQHGNRFVAHEQDNG